MIVFPRHCSHRLLIVIFLLLSVTLTVPALAAPTGSTNAQQAPTTPELIDQAFTRGEISRDQRLLYLIYAIQDFSQLPPQFHGRAGWSATMIKREINQARAALAAGTATFPPELRAALQQQTLQTSTVCDVEDGGLGKETAHFYISYGSINSLNIDQYANALETTFTTEISNYGWARPPLYNNPFGKYPVQVADIGDQAYGYVTTQGGLYTGTVGDNPNTAAVETIALASCMVVNSNMLQFTNNNASTALLALQVTMAHEHFHAVQFGYGDPGDEEPSVLYESTAVYVEDEVFFTAHDNYQYLYPNLTIGIPGQEDELKPYSMWPLFRYAAERNGGLHTASGAELMKLMWANVGAGQSGIHAFDNALQAKGTNLNNTFHNFAISLRFLKDCTNSVPYCFSDGSNIATAMGKVPASQGSIGSWGGNYMGKISDSYAANWIDLPTSGSYSIALTNTSASGHLRVSVVADLGTALAVTNIATVATAHSTITLSGYTVPTGAAKVVLVITNEELSADFSHLGASNYTVQLADAVEYDHFIQVPLVTR